MQPAALSASSIGVMHQAALPACIILMYMHAKDSPLHAAQSGDMQLGALPTSLGQMLPK